MSSSLFVRLLASLSKVTLSTYRDSLTTVLRFSGDKRGFAYWGGMGTFFSVLMFIIGYIVVLLLPKTSPYILLVWLIVFASWLLIPFGIFFYFFSKSERRAASVNAVLPNALSLISANLRAGMTPFQAVKSAAIPEFTVLGEELHLATNRAMGGSSFSEYLLEVNTRVNSPALHRTLRLFASSLKSGGHIAELLEGLASDISERASLKNELMTNIKTNLMFIMFIIIIGTPLLLSISIYFVDTVSGIQSKSTTSSSSPNVGGLAGEIKITSSFLTKVAYVVLFFTGLFAACFIGAVVEGEAKKGLHYAPIIIGASYALFVIIRLIIKYVITS